MEIILADGSAVVIDPSRDTHIRCECDIPQAVSGKQASVSAQMAIQTHPPTVNPPFPVIDTLEPRVPPLIWGEC